jgi:diadenosine tetraphosphate (Ap4A) HIT family hydrolase
MSFALHPQLVRDFHQIGRVDQIHIMLRKNAVLPWFILVPESNALEMYELEPPLRRALDEVADPLARFIKVYFSCDKINVAAIGNIVPQLHFHVIGRRRDDCCWPQAAWGHISGERAYSDEDIATLKANLDALEAFLFVQAN